MRVGIHCRPAMIAALGLAGLVLGGCAGGSIQLRRSAPSCEITECRLGGLSGRHLMTTHYDVYSTLFDSELEDALPDFLEACYRRYEATQPPRQPVEDRLQTFVFGSRQEWLAHTRERAPERAQVYARIRHGGYTEGSVSAQFYTSRTGLLATLAHEGWHQYAGSRLANRLPPWLDEGLACYHEAFNFAGKRPEFTPRHNTIRINSLRDGVQHDELFDLRELVRTDAGKVILNHQSRDTQIYYAQAWALVTFLKHGAGGKYAGRLRELLDDAARGELNKRAGAARLVSDDPAGTSYGEAVFYAYFGEDIEAIEAEYRDYLVHAAGF